MPGQEIPQGSLWLAELAEGYERPCVVVSRASLNKGAIVLVVPCTSSDVTAKTAFPNNVLLDRGTGGPPRDSAAMAHPAQPVEVEALRALYGQLPEEDLTRVPHALARSVDHFETP